jgi:adenine-specific DNA-methyltransferase
MSDRSDQRETIIAALKAFDSQPLAEPARKLFAILGYQSDRRLPIATPTQFRAQLDPTNKLTDREREALDGLQSLHLLFQLSDAELTAHGDLFDDPSAVHTTKIESYLFFAADLPPGQYTRTALSTLVRAINKPLPMPALVLFRHDDAISIGIIHRRLHKRDTAKDVLEKVTLIKDIACADPIRAHVEILNDFVLANLDNEFGVSNFVRLHEAWQKRLAAYALSNDFYREIADWYFWSHHQVDNGTIRLPQHCDTEQEKSLFLIRLLTRVIFCWFLVEKRLIPTDLFRERCLKTLLKEFNPGKDPTKPDTAPTYYRTILQNLFFGTLNMPPEQRTFREKRKPGEKYDQNYGITNLWRYETSFRNTADWLELAKRIPFLNGGLFDCLDDKTGKKKDNFILDGFSDRDDFGCHLPNDLFFGAERTVDLSKDYGEEDKRTARSKKAKVRGLIEILSRYKFTIEENTPLEEEIALDPELLGKVFENLLASYNEDTRTTARKALGAFYTPREIVSYMVDEALKSYLTTQVPRCKSALEDLFSNKATLKEIKPDTRDALIAAIGRVKILDPACGSGAFPMGALHRLVDLLQKLDPNNESWKRDRLAEARRYRAMLENAGAQTDEIKACDARIADIEKSFDSRFHALDFARKLYLIENSIYGVDIQPVATQIAKLRFFISLVVDQKVNMKVANLGVRPLPNLETRLVAADTLTPIEKTESDLFSGEIDKLRADLAAIRHEHFNARSPAVKRKWRDADAAKRLEIGTLLEQEHAIPKKAARQLAAWDPYDQNTFAPFFDPEWMFGLKSGAIQGGADISVSGSSTMQAGMPALPSNNGFDIVIGNPPYGAVYTTDEKDRFNRLYEHQDYQIDSYLLFLEKGMLLLRDGGVQALIVSNTWLPSLTFKKIRAFIFGSTQVVSLLNVVTNVFAAVVDTTVLIHRKVLPGTGDDCSVLSFEDSGINQQYKVKQASWYSPEGRPISIRATPKLQGIITEMERHAMLGDHLKVTPGCKPFQVGKGRPPQTRDIVNEKPFISERKKNGSFRPLLRGRFINRYLNYWNNDYWISFGEWLAEPRHTANYDAPTKIVVRQTGDSLIATLDQRQFVVMNNMFTIVPTDDHFSAEYALGVINSVASNWFYQTAINPEKGEALAEIKRGHLIRLPIPGASTAKQTVVADMVGLLLELNRILIAHKSEHSTRDPLMLAYWDQILNGLVYELYFPDELHGAGLQLFDLVEQTRLPDINAIPEPDRLPRLRLLFESLYDGAHPLRIALAKLQTLDTVRIIEGKS